MQKAGAGIGAMHAAKISAPAPPLSGESLREQNKWFFFAD